MAKKTQKEINLKELNVEELKLQLEKNTQDLFKLRFRSNSAQVKNVMEIRNIKRDIARINTFINQKGRQTA